MSLMKVHNKMWIFMQVRGAQSVVLHINLEHVLGMLLSHVVDYSLHPGDEIVAMRRVIID